MTVLDRFEFNVRYYPDRVALRFEEKALTFSELHYKSNRLASNILAHGNWNNRAIPICVERSLEMVIGILGILKAGGAFLPIDPEFPEERINMLILDSGSSICLTDKSSRLKIPSATNSILVDEDNAQPGAHRSAFNKPDVTAEMLAYIIYTSGSTGKPKGVMIRHSNLLVNIENTYAALDLSKCETFAIIATFSADGVMTALFASLCFGKCLMIFSKMQITDLHLLSAYLKTNPVDCYKLTPTLLKVFLSYKEPESILPKKVLIIGGEALQWPLVHNVFKYIPDARIFNHYGPTETTVGVVVCECQKDQTHDDNLVPLGVPLSHVQCFILSDSLQPVADREVGELFIGGPSVAKGYLNNPEQTNKRFALHNINGRQIRLYQTGDLVKLVEGQYHFLGRRDEQVKVKGYRIELGEIENVLNTHPAIDSSIVTVQNVSGNNILVGYFISEKAVADKSLTYFLQEKLPDYMVPRVWVQIEHIPLTSNGKTDRKKLPIPDFDKIVAQNQQDHYDNEIQKELVAIWRKFLPGRSIAIHDTFFELGGDSLVLMQLVTHLSNQYNVRFNQKILFDNLTISKLAEFIIKRKNGAPDVIAEKLEGYDENEATSFQYPLYFRNKFNPRGTPNSAITFQLSEPVNVELLEKCFLKVIGLHDLLRVNYTFSQGKVRELVSNTTSFKIINMKFDSGEIADIIPELPITFDFARDTLFRIFLIEVKDKTFMHVSLPHINSDGIAVEKILSQVEEIYNGGIVPAPGLQYKDFKRAFYAYLHSGGYDDDKRFWQKLLKKNVSIRFANRKDATNKESSNCTNEVIFVPASLDLAAREFLLGKNLTKFHLLLSAYLLCLYNLTKERDVVARIPLNYRNEPGFGEIVGLITNTIILRVEVDDYAPVSRFLENVSEKAIEVLSHGWFPFNDLMKILSGNDKNSNDYISTYFGYHNHRSSYRFGNSLLKMHMPFRNTEDLSLAINIFDTDEGYYIRMNSRPHGYTLAELKAIAESFVNILRALINSSKGTTVEDVLALQQSREKVLG